MPTLLRKAISTLIAPPDRAVVKASRNTLSDYIVNAPQEYGQPLPATIADVQGLITPQRMREVVMKTPTAAACMNTIIDYAAGVRISLRNVDHSKVADPIQLKIAKRYMSRPNARDKTWRRYFKKTVRDMVTLGFAGTEFEPDEAGRVANLNPIDSARLKIDYDEHGVVLGYDMINAHGMPVGDADGTHAWLPNEVMFFNMNPTSESVYSTSVISQLFVLSVIEDLMIYFISGRFQDSNVPFGVFDLGNVTRDELLEAVNAWNNQANVGHRIMLTGSNGGSKWYPFGYHLKDLECTALLTEVKAKIMAIFGVTVNEFGDSQDVNKSNGYNLSFTFKKRAIEPVLDEFCDTYTADFIHDRLGFYDLEAYYEEIDSRDQLLQKQIDDTALKHGVWAINQVRNREGLPSVDGGDEPTVNLGQSIIPVSMIRDFAEANLAALQAVDLAAQQGGTSAIKPPLIRGTQPPEKMTTPDGSGSSTVKIKYPQPGNQGQKPRGPVQTLRNAGVRKESMS